MRVTALDVRTYPDLSGSQAIPKAAIGQPGTDRATIRQLSPGRRDMLTCQEARVPEVWCSEGWTPCRIWQCCFLH